MYTCKITTFTDKDVFATYPAKSEEVFQKKKTQDKSPTEAASRSPKKIECTVCKKLEDALNKHLLIHHRESKSPIGPARKQLLNGNRENNFPKTHEALSKNFRWVVTTKIGDVETKNEFKGGSSGKKTETDVGKSVSDKNYRKENPPGGKPQQLPDVQLGKSSDNTKGPKMKQLTLLTVINNLKKKGKNVVETQESLSKTVNKRTTKTDTSSSREKSNPHTVPNLELSQKGECDLPTKKGNYQHVTVFVETKNSRNALSAQTARNSEPFKKEKCDFVTVKDSYGRYPCLWCKKTFSSSYNLSRHLLKHKESKNKQWFSCVECGKHFDRKDSLKKHNLSHKNERPHVCGTCRRRFKHKNHLNVHLKLNRCFKKDKLDYY